jgi:hypothetical protein
MLKRVVPHTRSQLDAHQLGTKGKHTYLTNKEGDSQANSTQ